MLRNILLSQVLFLDIETVPQHPSFNEMPSRMQLLWERKAALLSKNSESPETLFPRAGIYAEFGKIICISTARVENNPGRKRVVVKNFSGRNERSLLSSFRDYLDSLQQVRHLCAHNGKEFDFPYLCRRMMVKNISFPRLLNLTGKKPWEVPHLDTLELWKFGDYKNYTSLDLLAAIFGIESPKNEMDGSMVYSKYYFENDLAGIEKYCEEDVLTVMNIFLKMKGEKMIKKERLTC